MGSSGSSFQKEPPYSTCFFGSSTTSVPNVRNTDAYLFTYFTKNGEDGLHLAWSADGYSWARPAGGAALLGPEVGGAKLMRDPSVTRGPDGRYHLVWTTGWNENNIGHASTRDFLTWSSQQEIPVMAHEPTVLNCWAPEVHYDDASAEAAPGGRR